jgi:hypothetical protein
MQVKFIGGGDSDKAGGKGGSCGTIRPFYCSAFLLFFSWFLLQLILVNLFKIRILSCTSLKVFYQGLFF